MYDRLTRTLWHQFSGEPIIGELVGSDIELQFFPTARTTWGDWVAEHPDTTVITREGLRYFADFYTHEDDEHSIYYDYRAQPDSMFPIPNRDGTLAPKDEILGVTFGGVSKAYPISVLRSERVVRDEIGTAPIVVVASATSSDAHVYANSDEIVFRLPDGASRSGLPDELIDDEGTTWQINRESIREVGGDRKLSAVPSNVSFWFGWYAFHPQTQVYGR